MTLEMSGLGGCLSNEIDVFTLCRGRLNVGMGWQTSSYSMSFSTPSFHKAQLSGNQMESTLSGENDTEIK